jgi:hypothetical protein
VRQVSKVLRTKSGFQAVVYRRAKAAAFNAMARDHGVMNAISHRIARSESALHPAAPPLIEWAAPISACRAVLNRRPSVARGNAGPTRRSANPMPFPSILQGDTISAISRRLRVLNDC